MAERGRFAPTPSGRMHLGNVFSALIAWLSVRAAHGELVLRIEDLDTLRCSAENAEILKDDLRWLYIYFSGQKPDFLPKLHLIGTDFQREVWDILLEIPYGQTVTYGEIARKIADKRGLKTMSAQAVGGAVGHNRVSVVVPCHRVIGSNGSLTGYAGGIERKIKLLDIENGSCLKS